MSLHVIHAEIAAAKEAMTTHKKIEQALRERVAVLEQAARDRAVAHVTEVRALHAEIDRLRGRAPNVEQPPTSALERKL
jgi:hypothetical protein